MGQPRLNPTSYCSGALIVGLLRYSWSILRSMGLSISCVQHMRMALLSRTGTPNNRGAHCIVREEYNRVEEYYSHFWGMAHVMYIYLSELR